ncbi:MAG: phosphoglycerate kinase [Rickettsiales bacterium]|nr:phosphoglycerate kinase [Rickettsiales bacterium]|tara:strand:+ start:95232 stop:96428 length:1197 start_codon:yes stop_codon:yes gene_type:complete
MTYPTPKDYNVKDQVVFLRVDLNVPLDDNRHVTDLSRVKAIKPTLDYLVAQGAKVVLASHLGRPKGKFNPDLSMRLVLPALNEVFPKFNFKFVENNDPASWGQEAKALKPGQILVSENLRFYPGEEKGDTGFAAELAKGIDLYVNDAFACSHRAHASIVALAKLKPAMMGFLFHTEIATLTKFLRPAKKPLTAIIGGAKVSTKIGLLESLVDKVDTLVVVGAMANTFFLQKGVPVGKSLVEPDYINEASRLRTKAMEAECNLILPTDVMVADKVDANAKTRICAYDQIKNDDIVVDAGPNTIQEIIEVINKSQTVVWNGALGIAEIDIFTKGTDSVSRALAETTKKQGLISIAGGGDTLALIEKAGETEGFTYLSTAGGAFLVWLEGNTLPGISSLYA